MSSASLAPAERGHEYAARERDGYLNTFDNATRQSIIIDIEMTTIPVLLGICFLVGIVGNGALFYTICKAKRFRNIPNGFLLNITVSNMIMLIVCPPMIATSYVLEGQWPFGSVACKMVYSIPQAALAVSMFSLIGLSIERYGAFAAPPKNRDTAKNRACAGGLVIWILGGVCGLPFAIFAYEESSFERGPNNEEQKRVVCDVFNRGVWDILYPKVHTIVSITFLFLIPIILVTIFYLSLSCVVCGKKQRESRAAEEENAPLKGGTRSSRSGTLTKTSSNTKTNTIRTIDSRVSVPSLRRTVRKRKTMAKVALFLMIQFTILWAPRWAHTLRWYYSFEKENLLWYLMDLVGLICIYLNAALTPFTAVIFNRSFRHQLGKYLCCCFSCFHCCVCFEKKSKVESPLPSTSDLSVRSPRKRRCCICCCRRSQSDKDSDSGSDISKDSPDDPGQALHDPVNVYQELPGQGYYDSFTLPIIRSGYTDNVLYSAPNKPSSYHSPPQYGHTYAASEQFSPPRDSYAVAVNNNSYFHGAASYNGDSQIPPYDNRVAYSQHPYGTVPNYQYTSEPLLHAQAPKYSKIFMPLRTPQVEQATSIRELPAM